MPARIPDWVRRVGSVVASPAERENALHEWRRRRRGEPDLPPAPLRNILVLCMGNICRSPFAEGMLASRHPELALRSAGLRAGAGDPADPAALRAAARFGVDLASHKARHLAAEDVGWADLILAMEGQHLARLVRSWPQGRPKAYLLGDFLSVPPFAICDPWGQSDGVFDRTFQRIEAAVAQVSARLAARGRGCSGGS
jgi:protein-tyrosine phosphatase